MMTGVFTQNSLKNIISDFARQHSSEPEKVAQKIREEYYGDYLFPIGRLAEELGFTVLKRSFRRNSLSGYIACDDSLTITRLIVVNSADNVGHQRFTIAHELWHYFKRIDEIDKLAKEEDGFYSAYDTDPRAQDDEEQEANRFAAELLMPEAEFKIAYSMSVNLNDLTDKFGVSQTAINVRAATLHCVR